MKYKNTLYLVSDRIITRLLSSPIKYSSANDLFILV